MIAALGSVALAAPALAAAPATPRTLPWQTGPELFKSTYTPLPRRDTVIVNATILDGAGKRIDKGEILIRAGKIVAIGARVADRAGAAIVDANGRWVTPGVIDIHSHNGTFVLPLTDIDNESSDVSELDSPNVADTWVETAVNVQDAAFSRALAGGVTAIQILPGSSPIFAGRSVVVKPLAATHVSTMKFPGAAQGFKMACGENPKSQGAHTKDGPFSRQGEVAYVRQAFLDALQYRKAWEDYLAGRGAEVPRRDLKAEALLGIMAGDIQVNMHCYRADDMAIMLNVSREFGFRIAAFHHATEAYKIPELLRTAGTCAVVWGDWWGFKMEAQDAIRAAAPLLERAGACVTLHSDSPYSGQRLNVDSAAAAAAGRAIGVDIPPERMIRWITSNPAKVIGLADRIGTLAPGYNADIVLWSDNPFSIYTKPDLVLIDGAVVYDRSAPPPLSPSDFELGRPGVPQSGVPHS